MITTTIIITITIMIIIITILIITIITYITPNSQIQNNEALEIKVSQKSA